jgi:hypothetical protein
VILLMMCPMIYRIMTFSRRTIKKILLPLDLTRELIAFITLWRFKLDIMFRMFLTKTSLLINNTSIHFIHSFYPLAWSIY